MPRRIGTETAYQETVSGTTLKSASSIPAEIAVKRLAYRLWYFGGFACLCGAMLCSAGCDLSVPEGRDPGERSEPAHHQSRHHNHHGSRTPHPETRDEDRGTTHSPEEGVEPNGVPAKVQHVLRTIDAEHRAPSGYEGGRAFHNEGMRDERLLPTHDAAGRPIEYREWDVNPKVEGENRGAERLVTGSDGSAYYTRDHYRTFVRVR
jgi:guanyl-specific ribonuclease Sa